MAVSVRQESETDTGWEFSVEAEGSSFVVRVRREYWQKLTGGREPAESLVQRSFEFLLAREPVSSILREFDLSVIGQYFPEYEREIASG